ncbi:MAG: glycosyltransferase family 2 protein [Clostridia bacterium]|nr:glycosyltransferase family 2 protein [Clostridia bacterium]
MTGCKVSGCIVTHNNMRTIDKTLQTLLGETRGVDFKLYIVDNFSTDGTPELLRRKYGDDPRVEILEPHTNKGFGAGHNLVLPLLDSEFHAIINPDVIVRDDVLEKMAVYMRGNPDVGLLSPHIRFPDGRDQILGKRDPTLRYLVASRLRGHGEPSRLLREYAMLDEDLSVPRDIENATGCFMLIRTDLFRELGGFDPHYFMYFEDSDLTRTVRLTSRAVYYPDACIYHVWGRESKKNSKLRRIQIRSMLYYFRKWRR